MSAALHHTHLLCAACREQAATLERQAQQIVDLEQRCTRLGQNHQKLQQLHFGKQKPVDSQRRRKSPGKKAGEAGHGRSRPDNDQITNEETIALESCLHDGHELGSPVDSYERVVEDIPLPHQPLITRWEILRYWCPRCQRLVAGTVPGVIPGTRLGPNVLLYVMSKRHRFRKPIRLIAEGLSVYYALKISAGEINNLLARGAVLLGPAYTEIVTAVQAGKHVHCDETSWYIDGQLVWESRPRRSGSQFEMHLPLVEPT